MNAQGETSGKLIESLPLKKIITSKSTHSNIFPTENDNLK
jgi:hypothetical protein